MPEPPTVFLTPTAWAEGGPSECADIVHLRVATGPFGLSCSRKNVQALCRGPRLLVTFASLLARGCADGVGGRAPVTDPADHPRSPKDHALAYAALGWHVFPCRDKQPLTGNGFHAATTDAQQIAVWWDQWPDAEIGWVPGPSQHVVIDLDVPKNGGGDGREAFRQITGPEPIGTSLLATTPSGGQHLVYRMPEGRRYGMANLKRLGIDVRGVGGYVILPDGRTSREWTQDHPSQESAAAAPPWLTEWLDQAVGPARVQGEPRAYGKMSSAGTAPDLRFHEVRSALFAIEATVGRSDWLKCIFAVHDALQGDERGADLVEEWSAQAEAYDSQVGAGQHREGEAYRIFASAASVAQRLLRQSTRAPVTAATLFKFAADRGWKREPQVEDPDVEFGPNPVVSAKPPQQDEAPDNVSAKTTSNPDALRLQDWTDVAELPMVRWQVRRLLPERSMILLAGDTMMGKSFVAIDLAMRLVHGRPFFERKVKPCSVVYLCGEGQQGLAARLRLWRDQHSVSLEEAEDRYCLISNRIPELSPRSGKIMRELIGKVVEKKGHAPGLVIVDTLSQALEGDENDAAVTAPVLRALARLRDEYGCSVLIIHHTVKRDQKQAFDREGNIRRFPLTLDQVRGSGAITRNIDTVLGVQTASDDRDVFELVTLKQKDGAIAEPIRFQRLVAATGREDEDGEPETSCILVPAADRPIGVLSDKSADERQRERENSGIQRLVEALKREGRFSSRDAIVGSAGLNLQQGRVYLDIALSRKVIVDVGRSKRPVFALADEAERVHLEIDAQRATRPEKRGGRAPL